MPPLDLTAAAVMLAALVGYAVLGGADFGAGVWDLLARGPRAARQREVIEQAIAPIWEANHVWLILVVVVLFTAFPPAFGAIMTALHIPVTIMLVGIVLRGASFVFRAYDSREDHVQQRWGRVFAISSTITPIMLGTIIAGISSGDIELEDGYVMSGWFNSWLGVFPLAVGGFTLVLFAYVAAIFLTVETFDEPDLQEDFRRRGLLAAIALGAFALLVALLAGDHAPQIREELFRSWWSWPLQIATGVAAIGALAGLYLRHFFLARTLAVAQVALILVGWGASMSPYLVVDDVRYDDAAAPDITLKLMLGALAVGSLILFPSLYYLYRIFKGRQAFALIDLPGIDDAGPGGADEPPTRT
ncbi:MAG TPA: cytochrome d ubiquinol oxidase subunit II [Thermomicrobiales bacterium]|nr:cytochrome d ubiquinol oxidase subunit II [Thermomicrobiales bacterium]